MAIIRHVPSSPAKSSSDRLAWGDEASPGNSCFLNSKGTAVVPPGWSEGSGRGSNPRKGPSWCEPALGRQCLGPWCLEAVGSGSMNEFLEHLT